MSGRLTVGDSAASVIRQLSQCFSSCWRATTHPQAPSARVQLNSVLKQAGQNRCNKTVPRATWCRRSDPIQTSANDVLQRGSASQIICVLQDIEHAYPME
jgi:hypothetical protein